MREIVFTVYTFKEGKTYVAYAPALDVSSCGATDEEVRQNIRNAVRGFVEASADIGTLPEILEEAGYIRRVTSGGHPNSYRWTG